MQQALSAALIAINKVLSRKISGSVKQAISVKYMLSYATTQIIQQKTRKQHILLFLYKNEAPQNSAYSHTAKGAGTEQEIKT